MEKVVVHHYVEDRTRAAGIEANILTQRLNEVIQQQHSSSLFEIRLKSIQHNVVAGDKLWDHYYTLVFEQTKIPQK